MRKRIFIQKKLLFCLCLIFVLVWSVSVQAAAAPMQPGVMAAGWSCTHGQTGRVEQPLTGSAVPFGWGLEVSLPSGAYNWVHFSIPAPLHHKTRHINISFQTGSIDFAISQLDVYVGDTVVQSYPLNWTSAGAPPARVDEGVTLDADTLLTGPLAVSMRIGAGLDAMAHNITFYQVCADMLP